ncbi:HTH-type transcriptional regulator ArgP [Azohydromonas lata]|uniref:HTH-type transcriptional regulator ArgP n=1 Tax=Azohydromonas lata TaxID=45677 RepID=UPI001EE48B47|nr:HTH-type transcriptional regulator ArgP [Azohydromonas lata]
MTESAGMLDRQQLHTFATIVEEGSFERAAAILSLSRGAVSQRIKLLEESVSSILLVRQKPVVPTPAGEILLGHIRALRLLEDSTLRQIAPGGDGRGPVPLSIAVNPDSMASWLAPLLRTPLLQHSRVALEIIAEDQDHTLERLARGEAIGCISTASKASTGFVADALGVMEYRCLASTALAERAFPEGLTLQSALETPAVLFNRRDGLHDEFLQARFGMRIDRYPRHYLPAPGAVLAAVRAGCAYGLVPMLQLNPEGAAALPPDLVDLAPAHPVRVALYWHHWQDEPPVARELSEAIVALGRERLAAMPAAVGNAA